MIYASPIQYVPQVEIDRRPLVMWFAVAALSLATMLLIVGAPLALNAGHPFLGQTIYRAFSYVCHQIPDRSFFAGEHQFAVCARCTGLYAGFTVATAIYPLVKSLRQTETPARKWLFIAATPLAIDFILGFLGIWTNTHVSRFVTGALLGSVAVFYVMPGLLELSLRDWNLKRKHLASSSASNVLATEMFTNASSAPSDYSAPHRRI
ncbi:MAG: DUF2085 domain-containing protein [Acidobacteriota bacterium]|nr:DUF2085 domain-containing protein [Acidobacteriota bacterium]